MLSTVFLQIHRPCGHPCRIFSITNQQTRTRSSWLLTRIRRAEAPQRKAVLDEVFSKGPDWNKELIDDIQKLDKKASGLKYLKLLDETLKANAQKRWDYARKRYIREWELGFSTKRRILHPSSFEHRRLQEVVNRINRVIDVKDHIRHIRVVNNPGGRNARAYGFGYISVDSGLMQHGQWEKNQLAFVVGHEIAHICERHFDISKPSSIQCHYYRNCIHALDHFGSRSGVYAILGALLSAYIYAPLSRREHLALYRKIQADEYAADKGGLLIMKEAGFEVSACLDWSQKSIKREDEDVEYQKTPLEFRSHPPARERLLHLKACIAKELEADTQFHESSK